MKDDAPGIDMPNNMKPTNYPQDFVVSHEYPNHYPAKAKDNAPVAAIMSQVMPKL